jgi:chromosome segregation ATPase
MADPITNELLLEIMKNVKADVASLRLDVGELDGGMTTLSARLTSIDQRLTLVHTDLALLSERMDHLEARMDSIEGRLELVENRGRRHVRRAGGGMIYDTPKLSKALRDHAHFTLEQAEGRRTTWQWIRRPCRTLLQVLET